MTEKIQIFSLESKQINLKKCNVVVNIQNSGKSILKNRYTKRISIQSDNGRDYCSRSGFNRNERKKRI